MPWPEKQRRAIFLNTKRRKGLAAAKRLMHEAGYGGENARSRKKAVHAELRRRKKKRPS